MTQWVLSLFHSQLWAAVLLALCSAKQTRVLCTLSFSDDCLRWRADSTGVSLRPNPAFLLKVLSPSTRLWRWANSSLPLAPSSSSQAEQDKLLPLCPLRAYLAHIQPRRRTHSYFFFFIGTECGYVLGCSKGSASKQCLCSGFKVDDMHLNRFYRVDVTC